MVFKIFIIDDDPDFILLAGKQITAINPYISISSAENGYQALQQLKFMLPQVPNCILLDVKMPIMNGFEIVREIRKLHEFSKVTILMYSGFPEFVDEEKALVSGANRFVHKPNTIEGIQKMIRELLNNQTTTKT